MMSSQHDITKWCHMTSHDIMTSYDITEWPHNMMLPLLWDVVALSEWQCDMMPNHSAQSDFLLPFFLVCRNCILSWSALCCSSPVQSKMFPKVLLHILLSPTSAVKVKESVPSVCVCVCVCVCVSLCVCLSVRTPTIEPLWAKGLYNLGNAGGTWTLGRFHFFSVYGWSTGIE